LVGESNPVLRLERAASWTSRRTSRARTLCASGSGGARIHVSRSSAWRGHRRDERWSVSATDPSKTPRKKPDVAVTPRLEKCLWSNRPLFDSCRVTSAGETRGAYSPVDRRYTVFLSLRICDSTVRKSWKGASLCLTVGRLLNPIWQATPPSQILRRCR